MKFYRRAGGVLVGGPYNCPQDFATEELPDSDPEVIAFMVPRPPLDISDIDNLDKVLKALGLCIAQVGGLTVPQIKALFKNKYDSLP